MVVSDNLRSGVTKACFYEPAVNRTYAEMAAHYDTAVVPARPYRARDKAKVEVAVQVVTRFIIAKLGIERKPIDRRHVDGGAADLAVAAVTVEPDAIVEDPGLVRPAQERHAVAVRVPVLAVGERRTDAVPGNSVICPPPSV